MPCSGRRITAALKQLGEDYNHKIIAKLIRQLNLNAKIRRKKYRSYKGQQGKIENPKTIEALEKQIREYIHYYNYERIQLKLKGLSPVKNSALEINLNCPRFWG